MRNSARWSWLGVVLAVLVSTTGTRVSAQDPQTPVFRSSVDLLEVDVNIVDNTGRPIPNLQAADFSVTVDGKTRPVVTSEYVRDDAAAAAGAAAVRDDPYIATNTDRPRGRLIMLVVDQNNITSGRARDLVTSVRAFVTQLPAADRVALLAIPAPGPAVDFTSNRERIYEALKGIRGTDDTNQERYDVGDYEAIEMVNRGDEVVIRRLIERECGSTTDQTCISDLELEASRIVQRMRSRASESFYALQALLTNLKEAEGTKSLILISQGFILDDAQAKTAQLAQTAADSRVNLNVVLLDEVPGDASNTRRSKTLREDRDLREEGLDALAGKSRGALFRVTSSPQIAFDRLTLEMSGHYLLGVEPTQKDRDGKTHQIRVQVKRSGATIRSRREFRFGAKVQDTRAREDQVATLLRSSANATELPMRLSSYVFQDPESYKEKLLVATEIDPPATGNADLMFAFVLFDAQGKVVTMGRERKIYTGAASQTVEYNFALTVQPGTYLLRFGAIDGSGRRGSLEHEVKVWQTSTPTIAVGDLMLGRVEANARGGALTPVVSTRVDNGRMAAYTEFYSTRPEALDTVSVMMEVADGEQAPALLRAPAAIMPRVEGAGRQAAVVIPLTALPPGHYFARAVVSSGGEVVGRTVRPFEIVQPRR